MILNAHKYKSFANALRSAKKELGENNSFLREIEEDKDLKMIVRVGIGAQDTIPYYIVSVITKDKVGIGVSKRNPIDLFDVPNIAVQIASFRALLDMHDRNIANVDFEEGIEEALTKVKPQEA